MGEVVCIFYNFFRIGDTETLFSTFVLLPLRVAVCDTRFIIETNILLFHTQTDNTDSPAILIVFFSASVTS